MHNLAPLCSAPQLAESGAPGQEMWVDLELRLVADVGIIGVPNAGKSTLLSVVSAAKPKIANYPFTTLVPNLGVCELDFQTTVFADVPGDLPYFHLEVSFDRKVPFSRTPRWLERRPSCNVLGLASPLSSRVSEEYAELTVCLTLHHPQQSPRAVGRIIFELDRFRSYLVRLAFSLPRLIMPCREILDFFPEVSDLMLVALAEPLPH